jgi:hypothetical protein
MKKIFSCLATCCLTLASQAQFVKNDWGAIIGNPINDSVNGSGLTINGMEADASGNTIVIGTFKGTMDFDPSATSVNITSPESCPGTFLEAGFFAKYNSGGALVWAKEISGAGIRLFTSALAVDADGSIYLAGCVVGLGGSFDLDPNAGLANTPPNSTNFRAKYDSNGNFIWGNGFNDLYLYRTTQLFINTNNELVVMGASSDPEGKGSFVFLNKTDAKLPQKAHHGW